MKRKPKRKRNPRPGQQTDVISQFIAGVASTPSTGFNTCNDPTHIGSKIIPRGYPVYRIPGETVPEWRLCTACIRAYAIRFIREQDV